MEVECGYCHCGCGRLTPIVAETCRKRGYIKGKPHRFVKHHYSKTQPIGNFSHKWKNGQTKSGGRLKTYLPDHPRAARRGYVYNTILVAEKAFGGYIDKKHPIHHFDENSLNDSNGNLIVCEDVGYHQLLHLRRRAYEACRNAAWRKCNFCKTYDDPNKMYISPNGHQSYHSYHYECRNKYRKERVAIIKATKEF